MEPIEVNVDIRNNLVKARRLSLNMTQAQLAEAAGVSLHSISSLERFGYRNYKSPKKPRSCLPNVTDKVARYFKCSSEEIFPGWMQYINKTETTRYLEKEELDTILLSENYLLSLPSDELTDSATEKHEQSKLIQEMLKTLLPRQAAALTKRFGLDGNPACTFKEVGQDLGIGSERVRQLEAQAIQRIREKFSDLRL